MPKRTSDVEARNLPANLEAERSVLGAILLHESALTEASLILKPEDFFRAAHQRLYAAMLALSERRVAIDLVTLKEELGRTNDLDFVGGPAYIAALVDGLPRSMNVEHYAKILREKAILRAVVFAATEMISAAYEAEDDASAVVAQAEASIFGIGERETAGELVGGQQMASEGFDLLERLHTGKLAGLSTGLIVLDEATLGLHKKHLTVVAARPGRGKSALALHLARHIGIQLQSVVAVFSLEMSREELILRMVASEAHVGGRDIHTGRVAASEYSRMSGALGKIGNSGLYVDDTPTRTVLQIRSQCRRLKARAGRLDAVVIDYLQLMTPLHRKEANREQDVSGMSRGCKMLAKELDVPVVLLAQLSRAAEGRENQVPQLRDLRESGAIEQDADDVLFIHPPEVSDMTCDLIIAKQRNGPRTTLKIGYDESQFRFWNLAHEERS